MLHADGSTAHGWPRTIFQWNDDGYIFKKSHPVMSDLGGDGDMEIVIGSADGRMHAFDGDGSYLPGWPQTTIENTPLGSPAIGDITGDGQPEIVAEGMRASYRYNYLYAWSMDGTLLPNWPVRLDFVGNSRSTHTSFGFGSISMADIDNDGVAEIIASSDVSVPKTALRAYNGDGSIVPGFPKPTIGIGASSTNNALITDLNGDNSLDLVWVDDGNGDHNIYVWNTETPVGLSHQPWPEFRQNNQQNGNERFDNPHFNFMTWKSFQGIGSEQSSLSDQDQDGIALLLEYALGLNPLTPDSFRIETHYDTSLSSVECRFPELRSNLTYTIKKSHNLIDWTTEDIVEKNKGIRSIPFDTDIGKLFLRLEVSE